MLELTIYFQELNYHVIEQKPAYDSESLLGMCIEEFQAIYVWRLSIESNRMHLDYLKDSLLLAADTRPII